MFTLLIKYKDGSVYWTEYFNSKDALDAWLKEEQTRHYWKEEFTTEVIDNTPPPPSKEDLAKAAEKEKQMSDLKSTVKKLAAKNDLTAAEVKLAIQSLLEMKDMNGEFDS